VSCTTFSLPRKRPQWKYEQLLMGLEQWLAKSGMTQAAAAKMLGVAQARVSDLKRGKAESRGVRRGILCGSFAGLGPVLL
jgi:hypothetical protein